MFRTWASSDRDQQVLSRRLEAHLNEHASTVISVSYAVSDQHYVLAVYRGMDFEEELGEVMAEAELIVEEAQA